MGLDFVWSLKCVINTSEYPPLATPFRQACSNWPLRSSTSVTCLSSRINVADAASIGNVGRLSTVRKEEGGCEGGLDPSTPMLIEAASDPISRAAGVFSSEGFRPPLYPA